MYLHWQQYLDSALVGADERHQDLRQPGLLDYPLRAASSSAAFEELDARLDGLRARRNTAFAVFTLSGQIREHQ
jgi:hypothetical protein